jgi:DNA gyrase subunit A
VIQADGQVKVVGPQLLGRLHLDEPAPLGDNPSPARLILPISEKPALLAFTDAGRVALLRWEFAGQQPGTLEKFLPEGMNGEQVVQLLPLPSGEQAAGASVGLLSSDGRFKRLPLEDFQELSGRAASVLKLKDGVTLQRVVLCREGEELVAASSTGRLLRLTVNEANLPVMGRNAQGPVLLRLLPGESVIAVTAVRSDDQLWLVSRFGRFAKVDITELRQCHRGDLGQIGIRFKDRNDELVGLEKANTGLLTIIHANARNERMATNHCMEPCITMSGEIKEVFFQVSSN